MEGDSASLALAIVIVFCLYNVVLGSSMLGLLRLIFIRFHGVQVFFRNVMLLPLMVLSVALALIPYGVTPFVLNYVPSLGVQARAFELTQLAGTMLHLELAAIVLFLAIHGFWYARDFMDSNSHLINFFEMSAETFIKLLFVGVLIALLLVADVTVHPEFFKGVSGFALFAASGVIILLLAALELGNQLRRKPERSV